MTNTTWDKEYGWNLSKRPPDFTRCCANVASNGSWGSHQCYNKARYDKDEQGRFTHCKRHNNDTAEKKKLLSQEAQKVADIEFKKRAHGPSAIEIVRKIAEGHHDPRILAVEFMERFDDT